MSGQRANPPPPWPRRAGLTLAELLVALVIGGMTLVITAQATLSVRQWGTRLAQEQQADDQMTVLYQFTQTVLSQALPLPYKNADGQEVAPFEGNAQEVRFVRAEPGYPSRAGLYQYHLFAGRDGTAWSLVLERELLPGPGRFGTMQAPVRLVLYQGPQQPGFAYRGAGDWQKSWPQGKTPPALVRFTMQGWPALNIALSRPQAPGAVKGGEKAPKAAGPDASGSAKTARSGTP